MRLLNVKTRRLEEFFDSAIPTYAILSHTWGSNEVTFEDITSASTDELIKSKQGYAKIEYTCTQADKDHLSYAWVDTCCIDKSSSAELSEAINSMYRWYSMSEVCYVYMSDVPGDHGPILPHSPSQRTKTSSRWGEEDLPFVESRWFTRGWTLQELIAPHNLIFYGAKWNRLGGKHSMSALISSITGVDQAVLTGKLGLNELSIAKRMSWASQRSTSRIEDQAYCLLGLFGVHIPLLYGEGEAAFTRLQEEIIRLSDDLSILAWDSSNRYPGVLAPSAHHFQHARHVTKRSQSGLYQPFSFTNKGLQIELPVIHNRRKHQIALLDCDRGDEPGGSLAFMIEAARDGLFDVITIDRRVFTVDLKREKTAKVRMLCVRRTPPSQLGMWDFMPLQSGILKGFFQIHQNLDKSDWCIDAVWPPQDWHQRIPSEKKSVNGIWGLSDAVYSQRMRELGEKAEHRRAVTLVDRNGNSLLVTFGWGTSTNGRLVARVIEQHSNEDAELALARMLPSDSAQPSLYPGWISAAILLGRVAQLPVPGRWSQARDHISLGNRQIAAVRVRRQDTKENAYIFVDVTIRDRHPLSVLYRQLLKALKAL